MVGRPAKRLRFRRTSNNGSENFIYNETENKDFTLQGFTSCRIKIPFFLLTVIIGKYHKVGFL